MKRPKREWLLTNKSCKDANFTLMSYNVLAQSKIKRDLIYPYCSKKSLKSRFRHKLLVDEIQSLSPDIICMQEVYKYESFWNKELGHSYNSRYVPARPHEEDSHGIAIFWKKELFSVVEKKEIFFNRMKNDYENEDQQREFGSHQVAQIVVLKSKSLDKKFAFVNTHLYWNPYYQFVRLRQIEKILDTVRAWPALKNISLFFAGDLNVTPENILYNILVERSPIDELDMTEFLTPLIHYDKPSVVITDVLDEDTKRKYQRMETERRKVLSGIDENRIKEAIEIVAKIYEFAHLKSVYGCYKQICVKNKFKALEDEDFSHLSEPNFTNYVKGFKGTLDYILIPKDQNMFCCEILSIPSLEEVSVQTALPNDALGSDHISIMARFEICSDK